MGTRAYFVVYGERDFDTKRQLCKLYKTMDGYPSEVQKLVRDSRAEQLAGGRFYSIPDHIPVEKVVKRLLETSILIPPTATERNIDYIDYKYEISECNVTIYLHKRLEFKGTIDEFMVKDFSAEWVD